MKFTPNHKIAGVLAPVFALRGSRDLGVGDTDALRELVDWCAKHGFGMVQVLPVNEPGGDSSPYNIISSVALDPLTIATHPKSLRDLSSADFKAVCARHDIDALRADKVNYRGVRALKGELLEAAWNRFKSSQLKEKTRRAKDFQTWAKKNAEWLGPYTLFRALVRMHRENEMSDHWPRRQRAYASAKKWLAAATPVQRRKVRALRDFFAYVQWIAYGQWLALRKHATDCGVALVGDVPVGVSLYSADVFAHPKIFDVTRCAGAPPEKFFAADAFTAKWGQNWGFPLYAWEEMAKDDYAWWRQRLRKSMEIFHALRVDHALGFFRIYSFPWRPERNAEFLPLNEDEARDRTDGELPRFVPCDDSTPQGMETNRMQGERLFRMILEETGPHRIIAEDLGELSPYVRPTLQALHIPGFKSPQWERTYDGWPVNGGDYERESLTTYATHDHPSLRGYWDAWWADTQSGDPHRAGQAKRQMEELAHFAQLRLHLPAPWSEQIHEALLRALFQSNSWLAVNMITDLFGTSERFNVPGAAGDRNWTERFPVPISQWDERWPDKVARIDAMLRESGRLEVAPASS